MDDSNETDTSMEKDLEVLEVRHSFLIIIYYCCFAAGLVSNLTIIFFTYRRNAKSVIQTYFLMYTVVVAFELIISCCILTSFNYSHLFHVHQYFIFVELAIGMEFTVLLFIFVMSLIWFFAINSRIFKGHFNVVLITIFVLVSLYYIVFVFHCMYKQYCHNAVCISMTVYVLTLVLVLSMHTIKCVLRSRNNRIVQHNNFILVVITLYVLCWLPNMLLTMAYKFNMLPYSSTVYILAECLGCLYSFFNLIAFVLLYRNWRMRLVNFFKCDTNTYARAEDNLIDSAEDVSEVTTI